MCSSAKGTTYSARPNSSSTSSVTNSHTSSLGYVFYGERAKAIDGELACVARNRFASRRYTRAAHPVKHRYRK